MSCVIIDPCNFTRVGLKAHLQPHQLPVQCFSDLESPQQLEYALAQSDPRLVFISCQCFENLTAGCEQMQSIIAASKDRLFIVLMSLPDSHFNGFLYLRENIIVVSKALAVEKLDQLLSPYLFDLKYRRRRVNQTRPQPVTLSPAETEMLKMWMSGYNTLQISKRLNIKAKTISSHKGNIRKKINTQNVQVIHQLMKISDTVTPSAFTWSRHSA